MKVYILDNVDSFLTVANKADIRLIRGRFIGSSLANDWKPFEMIEVEENGQKYDMSKFALNPIFSEAAVHKLFEMLKGKAEILPYSHSKDKYYAINVTNLIDCIDVRNSVIDKDTVVPEITKFAFIEHLIEQETIFKIPQYKATHVFVTNRFRDYVIESNLTGFKFNEVWNSESTIPVPNIKLSLKGPTYTYKEAELMVGQGKTLANEKWALQQHNNTVYLGQILEGTGEFFWIKPLFIPPALFDMEWYVVNRFEITKG